MITTKPTIGGDPEFFIVEKIGDKYKAITADKVLPSKLKKAQLTNGWAFFDGVQAELNPNPANCREHFIGYLHSNLAEVYDSCVRRLKIPEENIAFTAQASIPVDKDILKGADKECFRFGCSPDFNIYTESPLKYPDGKKFMTRFAGGHIHLGFDDINYHKKVNSPEKLLNLVRLLDTIPGVMAIAISNGEEEKIRRGWYGKAGTYRIQTHGLEYRTLSSFWLLCPPLTSLFTGLARDCFTIVYNDMENIFFDKVDVEEVRKIIDTSDIDGAKKFYYNTLSKIYDKECSISNSPMRYRKSIDIMVKNGYRHFFDPYKMLNYWNIREPYLVLKGGVGYYGIASFNEDDNMENLKIIMES